MGAGDWRVAGRCQRVALAVGVIVSGLACSTTEAVTDLMRPVDSAVDLGAEKPTASDASTSDGRGDARCTIPIEQIECASTLDGQRRQDRFCRPGQESCLSQIGPCGNYQVYFAGFGIGSLLCIYDRDGQPLLSAMTCTDINVLCNDTSFCASGGADIDINASCALGALSHPSPPPGDGGGDGGASG